MRALGEPACLCMVLRHMRVACAACACIVHLRCMRLRCAPPSPLPARRAYRPALGMMGGRLAAGRIARARLYVHGFTLYVGWLDGFTVCMCASAVRVMARAVSSPGRLFWASLVGFAVEANKTTTTTGLSCAGAMCTAGWCKCARGVALWRGWGIPLKGAALGSCQTRPSGDIRRPGPQEGSHWSGLPDFLP